MGKRGLKFFGLSPLVVLLVIIVIIVFFAVIRMIWVERENEIQRQKESIPLKILIHRSFDEYAHVIGNASSSVRVIVFFDPNCPFCKLFHERQLSEIMRRYPDVAVEYRYGYLENQYPTSRDEMNALECVSRMAGKEKFWEMLQFLFLQKPKGYSVDDLAKLLSDQYFIKKEDAERCIATRPYETKIDEDFRLSLQIPILKIPTAVIGDLTRGTVGVFPGASSRDIFRYLSELSPLSVP